MKNILVTGGSGWLGMGIVRALLERGDSVIATDITVSESLAILASKNSALKAVAVDLGNRQHVINLLNECRPDAVIHAAAIVGVVPCAQAPHTSIKVNIDGSVNLFEAMLDAGVRRVIHVSTEETYGDFLSDAIDEDHPQNPVSIYGTTKLAVEHLGRVYSRDYGLECINVRTCWVYGPHLPRLRVPRTFVEAALRGEKHHLPEGADFSVDQVYIDDTVSGILLALDKVEHRFDSYNVATGVAVTVGDVAVAVNRTLPGDLITVGTTGVYKHGGSIVSARKGALNISRAKEELGYVPRFDIQQGIDATIEATRLVFEAAVAPEAQ